jgi:hypothetical protein
MSKRLRVNKGRSIAGVILSLVLSFMLLGACTSTSTNPHVLLVGTFNGIAGQYKTIDAALAAAKPGDWILIAPGDYHENYDLTHGVTQMQANLGDTAGVLVTVSNLHIRGMNRNTVIVDGTKKGAPACSSEASDQEFGPNLQGKPSGRNGIVVYKANDVWIENLTVCNFLAYQGQGNEIWWDGGAGTAKIGLKGYWGSYLTATSTYYGSVNENATYGIFANNAAGPAFWDETYASNFNDSGMYVGACQQVCDITINHAWMEYNVLGYSGTNSGGQIIIENSKFDNNQDGFDTNTQIAGDPPPPQNGDCPNNGISPITHTHSCWVFMHNLVIDNNNPNAPEAPGYASAGPVGTGMTISGGRNDTVMDNTFENNGAWGILFVPFPDSDKPYKGVTCANSGGAEVPRFGCVYDPESDALINNKFIHNGYFGNPTNGDYGELIISSNRPSSCFSGNVAPDGSTPSNLQQTQTTCGVNLNSNVLDATLLSQILCDTKIASCPAGANYPQASKVTMKPLPGNLATMPNPCKGVPSNPWCKDGKPV